MSGAYGDGAPTDPSLRRPGSPGAASTVPDVRDAVVAARRDPRWVLLEGVHALKHALRFGAEIELVATPALGRLRRLLGELAADVEVPTGTVELDPATWRSIVPLELPSPVVAVARRPATDLRQVVSAPGRIVTVERPRHLGNLGAVIRVAAAAGAAGVLVLGDADPWHPTAVRAAAGLQFALPVVRLDVLPDPAQLRPRPLVALHPDGDTLDVPVPDDAVLLVGTERAGLSPQLLERADRRVRLPMRSGVSSLNLATAVAAALYAGVSGTGPPR